MSARKPKPGMTAVTPKSAVSYASSSTSSTSPGSAPVDVHRPRQRMPEAEVERAGVGVRALARELAVEAVRGLEPDLLARGDLRDRLDVRMPAVVHQSSSATRSAAAAARRRVLVAPGPRRPELVDRDDRLELGRRRRSASRSARPARRRSRASGGRPGRRKRPRVSSWTTCSSLPELRHDRLGPQVDRPLVAQRPDARAQRLVRHGESVVARKVLSQRHAVGAQGNAELFQHGVDRARSSARTSALTASLNGAATPTLAPGPRDRAVDEVDLASAAPPPVEQHRRAARRGSPARTRARGRRGRRSRARSPEARATAYASAAQLRGDRPRVLVGDDLADRPSSTVHVPLKATLQTSFSQTSRWTSSKVRTVNPARRQTSATASIRGVPGPERSPSRTSSIPWWWAWPGADHRGAEAAGHADGDAVVAEHARGGVRAAEPVLDREHERLGPDERRAPSAAAVDVHRLRREHDQLGLARLGRVRRRSIRTVRSPLAPSTRRPRRRIASTCSSQGSIAHTSWPALPADPRTPSPSPRRRRLRSSPEEYA